MLTDDLPQPRLVFTRDRTGDNISLCVSHDRAKSIFGWASRDTVGLEMPAAFWVRVIPAVVSLMSDEERADVLNGIGERVRSSCPSSEVVMTPPAAG